MTSTLKTRRPRLQGRGLRSSAMCEPLHTNVVPTHICCGMRPVPHGVESPYTPATAPSPRRPSDRQQNGDIKCLQLMSQDHMGGFDA